MQELSIRLSAIESQIRRGSRVADIGTDHAYLPIHIIQSGLCEEVIACDIRQGPLNTAEKNVKAAGVSGISLRLGDGLSPVSAGEIDTAIIAGMGGEIISKIIENSPFVKSEGIRLILQPMTSAEDLRDYLSATGFDILNEFAVEDAGRIYPIITAVYSGNVGCYGEYQRYIGHLDGKDEAERKYILKQYNRLKVLCDDLADIPRKARERQNIESCVSQIELIVKRFCDNG